MERAKVYPAPQQPESSLPVFRNRGKGWHTTKGFYRTFKNVKSDARELLVVIGGAK